MTSMKEPPLSRGKKPTTTNHTQQPKKLKLVCSFNGAFHPRPPSGKLRYIGGETRIISVDRNVGFSKLRSKIAGLSPNIASFIIKYQLPELGSSSGAAPLVRVDSDDDVRRMVEAFEKLDCYGKSARLWLFVCSNSNGYSNGVGPGHGVGSETRTRVEGEKAAVKKHGDESLRKMVLKQQLLAKQSGLVRGFGFSESDMEVGGLGETRKREVYEPLLIDLDPDRDEPKMGELNSAQFSVARSNPLNLRDVNLRVDQALGRSGSQVLCNGVGPADQSVSAVQGLEPVNYSGVKPGCNDCDVKKDVGKNGIANVNRENIMPWGASCNLVKDGLSCHSCGDSPLETVNPLYAGDRVCGGLNSSIRNHRFGANDTGHQRYNPFCVRNHKSNTAEMGNHLTVRLDGRLSTRKCFLGLRPHMSIAKQGQSVRVYHPNSWRHYAGFSEDALAERVRMMNSSSIKDRSLSGVQHTNQKRIKEYGPGRLQHMNVNPKEYCVGYYGAFTRVGDQSLLNCDVTDNLFPSVRTMDTQENLVTVSSFGKYESVHGVSSKCEPIHRDLDKETCLKDIVNCRNTSGTIDNKLPNEETVINSSGNSKNGSNDMQDSYNGVTCSVNISLRNLSLSKEVEGPQLSSHASCVVTSDTLLKPQDLRDEGQFILGPQVKESNRVASNPSSQNSAKIEKCSVHVEEVRQDPSSSLSFTEEANHGESLNYSKVIGGTSNDLAALYTHLATRELQCCVQPFQTIKNSDLEFIKELGSGTYGTVYHGKWKGSNVAIKKIKPSCFTDGVLEDRLLADFWKEAHILGQLHHPNVVAFYGVVTDGPVTNLATVTEYMVNGSLKQVLRRKDRTIDRRKRLILAMDAAFGMEYLHEKSIVHFDLKSHNFLVNMRDPQRPVCKIGDLGLSKIKQRTLVSGGVRGTVPWMAPELLNSNSKNNLVTEKVDVYSFGIVMWELLTGEEPYANLRSEEIIVGIIKGSLRPEIPSWCDPTWKSLMERCWSSDPESRPPFSEISKELRAMSAAMNIK
ncbi:uncharacterized protein LOC112183502 isoform X2 [Rosa chinensis]|uniref:uncharacterized protein LOC112183502 isoform X2 n=1 Tax=Rosa chinensis TaxID=74649 RepID=UPI001AD8ADB6|nr:uncharacterized protein LOC112183502 isoform X2 [Rosa chinensis]